MYPIRLIPPSEVYRAILEEIAAESPEVAARVATRIEKLNAETGLASGIGR